MIIKTDRLILRPWCDADLEPFAEMNADLRVMEYFPSVLSREESDNQAKRVSLKLNEQGWGLWAVSVPGVSDFIGFIGLAEPTFKAHFTPAIEIGWRLAFEHWGQGYATEGAKEVIKYAFDVLKLDEIVSFAAVQNLRSRKVMEKIGMHHQPNDDFDHPNIPEGNELRRLVLYRLSRND